MAYLAHLKEAYCLLNHNSSLPLSTLPVFVFDWSLETFRFKDKDDYKFEIWLKIFFRYSQIKDTPQSFIFPFLTRKVSTATFSEGGYILSWSQNDKTSNIW